jgi:hypothetical protein
MKFTTGNSKLDTRSWKFDQSTGIEHRVSSIEYRASSNQQPTQRRIPMVKAGLILGIVMLVLGAGGSLITPICVPCIALIAGAGAGYLACVYAKPATSGGTAKVGAGAGTISGAGALIGQVIGGILNAVIVGPEGAVAVAEAWGLPVSPDPNIYYVSFIGSGLCFGILDVLLMAGLGALGGILWYQISGKKASPTTPSYDGGTEL